MPSSTEPDGKGKGKCVVKDEPVAAARGRTPAVREDDQAHMPVHLFVAAIGDGELNPNTAPKTRETLAQIIKKVSIQEYLFSLSIAKNQKTRGKLSKATLSR